MMQNLLRGTPCNFMLHKSFISSLSGNWREVHLSYIDRESTPRALGRNTVVEFISVLSELGCAGRRVTFTEDTESFRLRKTVPSGALLLVTVLD